MLLRTVLMIFLTGMRDEAASHFGVCEDNPVIVCGEGHRLVHSPRAKVYTCQSDHECHVTFNIDISANHFLHCLNSSLCIVDFNRIKNYLSEDTTGIGLRNSSCSLRQVNSIGLRLMEFSCLPDKGPLFLDIFNKSIIQQVESELLLGYILRSEFLELDASKTSRLEQVCTVTASSGTFSKVAVVNSFVGKEEVKIKNKKVDCVSLSPNTFYGYREINSTNRNFTLEIPLGNFLHDSKAFQFLLWIKVTPRTTVSMNCALTGKESERKKRSACTRLIVEPSLLIIPTMEPTQGSPINPIGRKVAISVVAGVVFIVVATSIACAVIYTRRYKRKLEEPHYDTMGSEVEISSSHYTIPNSFGGEQEPLPRSTQTTAQEQDLLPRPTQPTAQLLVNSTKGNQILQAKDGSRRRPVTPILPNPRSEQNRKSPAVATVSGNSAGYSHAFDHLPRLQGHCQRPNLNNSDPYSEPNYLSF